MGADMSTCPNGHVCECCLRTHTTLRIGAGALGENAFSALFQHLPIEFTRIANKLRMTGVSFSDSPKWLRQSASSSPASTLTKPFGTTNPPIGQRMAQENHMALDWDWGELAPGGGASLRDLGTVLGDDFSDYTALGLNNLVENVDVPCASAASVSEAAPVRSTSTMLLETGRLPEISELVEPSEMLSFMLPGNCATVWCDEENDNGFYDALYVKNNSSSSDIIIAGSEEEDISMLNLIQAHLTHSVGQSTSRCTSASPRKLSGEFSYDFAASEDSVDTAACTDLISGAGSPNGTADSTVTLTDVELIFADLDKLLEGRLTSAHQEECNVQHLDPICNFEETASEMCYSSSTCPASSGRICESDYAVEDNYAVEDKTMGHAPTMDRRRGRKRCGSPASRRERKRQQNREAAQRYRSRKSGEVGSLDQELESAEQRNRELRDALRRAETERTILLRFADRFDLRGLMRDHLLSAPSKIRFQSQSQRVAVDSLSKLSEKQRVMSSTSRSPMKSQRSAVSVATNGMTKVTSPAAKSSEFVVGSAKSPRNMQPSPVSRKPARTVVINV